MNAFPVSFVVCAASVCGRRAQFNNLAINLNANMIRESGIVGLPMLRGIGLVALFMVVSLQAHAQTSKVKEWRKQVRIQLTSSASYPPAALGQLGSAKVGFVLDGEGRLVSHWLVESTGNLTLDQESLAIIERSKTFPKPPPDLKGRDQAFSIEFFFRRRPGAAGSWDEEQARLRAKVNSICRGC